MGGVQRRSRTHRGIRDVSRKARTRKYTKDLDQIQNDMRPENAARLAQQPKDADLPGLGQNYCIQCARHFITGKALNEHYRGKVHKKRVKDLKEEAYTQKEAEAAVGFTTDNGTRGGVRKSAVQDAIMTDLDQ